MQFSVAPRAVWGVFVVGLVLGLGVASASAQIVFDSYEINPIPGPIAEDFGRSVALGQDFIVVGSEIADVVGAQSGGVSVYDRDTRAYLRTLSPPGHAPSDLLGSSMAIEGNTLVVGARISRVSGRAFLFDVASGNWLRTLVPSDIDEARNFGMSVAMYGDIVLVGSPGSPNLDGTLGGVYLYSLSNPTDNEVIRLRPDFFVGDDRFGHSVAVNEDYGVVGVVNSTSNGAVYVFDIHTGARLHRLLPDPSATNPSFGSSVALVGNLVIVGAERDDERGFRAGAVYLFDAVSGDRLLKLVPAQVTPTDNFGACVAVSNNALIVGSPGDGVGRGSAYVFAGPNLDLIDVIIPPEIRSGDAFGRAISIDGAEALIGAASSDPDPGAAYLVVPRCAADLNRDGRVDFFDVSALIGGQPDYNGDGVFNFFDVSAFMNDYQGGCL